MPVLTTLLAEAHRGSMALTLESTAVVGALCSPHLRSAPALEGVRTIVDTYLRGLATPEAAMAIAVRDRSALSLALVVRRYARVRGLAAARDAATPLRRDVVRAARASERPEFEDAVLALQIASDAGSQNAALLRKALATSPLANPRWLWGRFTDRETLEIAVPALCATLAYCTTHNGDQARCAQIARAARLLCYEMARARIARLAAALALLLIALPESQTSIPFVDTALAMCGEATSAAAEVVRAFRAAERERMGPAC